MMTHIPKRNFEIDQKRYRARKEERGNSNSIAKHNNDDNLKKLKTRLCAGGHRKGVDDRNSSPTVDYHSIILILVICKFLNLSLHTTDVPAAYLNAILRERILMILQKDMS